MNILAFEYTDLGNAKRWASMFSTHYKKVPELDKWLYWDGCRWVVDIHGHVVRQTIDKFLDSLTTERRRIEDAILATEQNLLMKKDISPENCNEPEIKTELNLKQLHELLESNIKWHKACQAKGRIEAFLSLACSMGASKSYTEFDSKGRYMGVNNGVLHLGNGEFIQNDPSYFIMKSSPADFKPSAICPNWDAFLETIFEGDAEQIRFIQRVAGESLLGERCKTKLIMLTGDGANGKSTFVDTLMLLLGNYAITTNPDAITSGNKSNDYYLASMKGARLAILNESRANAKLDNNMVKQLVDSGMVQARQIYGTPFEFQPVATPILTTNNPPVISSEYAINRRLLCVPFKHQIPESKRDPNFIKTNLLPELSGILNWALEGCRQYAQQGLNPPESILKSTKEYIFEHDRVLKYVHEEYDANNESKVSAKDFYKDYLAWCQRYDFDSYTNKHLYQELRGMGYQIRISTGNVFYIFGLAKKQIVGKNVIAIDNKKANQNALMACLEFDSVTP